MNNKKIYLAVFLSCPRQLRRHCFIDHNEFSSLSDKLWCSFLQIVVDGDVLNAKTWEVLPLKNPIEPPYGLDTFVQTKGGTHKNYPVQLKHQVPIMYQ